jgi:hypothetical protein
MVFEGSGENSSNERVNAPVQLSVIVPLFDRRDCEWQALESAIAQEVPRDQYEIVVVMGRDDEKRRPIPDFVKSLLAQCDRVVRSDLDPEAADGEIAYYYLGFQHSTGNFLFFIEGHTKIAPGAIRGILSGIRKHPECELFWGLREDIAKRPLGRLIAVNNARHQARAEREGHFSFGGTSIVRRDLLNRVGGIDPSYGRFNEVILRHRILFSKVAAIGLDLRLTYHYNDMTVAHLADLSRSMGKGKYAVYRKDSKYGPQSMPPMRHPAYGWLGKMRAGFMAYVLLRAVAIVSFYLAVLSQVVGKRLAFKFYYLGLGCSDFSGFCHAQGKRARGGNFLPSAGPPVQCDPQAFSKIIPH